MTRRILAFLLALPLLLGIPALPTGGSHIEALPPSEPVVVPVGAPMRQAVSALEVTAEAPPPEKTPVTAFADIRAQRATAAAQAAAQGHVAGTPAVVGDLATYTNGHIPREALCPLPFAPGQLLECAAAADLTALNEAYRAHWGRNLHVTDSYRSYAGQVLCEETKGSMCATPGTSNHGWGAAVDVGGGIQYFDSAQHAWMVANAGAFGWYLPGWAQATGSKPEAWHWQHRPVIDALVQAGLVRPGF